MCLFLRVPFQWGPTKGKPCFERGHQFSTFSTHTQIDLTTTFAKPESRAVSKVPILGCSTNVSYNHGGWGNWGSPHCIHSCELLTVTSEEQQFGVSFLGPPARCPLILFWGEGSPTKIDYRKRVPLF